MAILTHDEILQRVAAGEIGIEPFDEQQVGPASVDLHLGSRFRVFKTVQRVHHVTEDADVASISEVVEVDDHFILIPGQTVLGITEERVRLPNNLCGWLEGRSRFARLGLMVHITASFMQPGIDNHQVLEITNAGPIPLALHPGIAVCQFIFEECRGEAHYHGRYEKQSSP